MSSGRAVVHDELWHVLHMVEAGLHLSKCEQSWYSVRYILCTIEEYGHVLSRLVMTQQVG